MSYSRIMFAKYWGLLDEVKAGKRIQKIGNEEAVDIFDEPQKPIHERIVTPWPLRTIKYLDKDGKEQSIQC